MNRFAFLFGLFVAGATGTTSFAAEPEPEPAPARGTQAQVIITATRAPAAPMDVGSAVTVITGDTLARDQALFVADALVRTPGVVLSRNGGYGGVTSVRLRGAESDQTVFLLDGVKLNDPSSPGGGFNFANLMVGDVARIEILRGPQSTLYGSQAIGGVVNLITRDRDSAQSAALSAEVGEQDFQRVSGRANGRLGAVSYAASVGHFETDGVSALARENGGRERDGYSNSSLYGRVLYDLSQGAVLEARASWSKSDVNQDGFPPPFFSFADTRETLATEERLVFFGAAFGNATLRHRASASRTDTDREGRNPDTAPITTFLGEGVNERLEWQTTWTPVSDVIVTAGLEREESKLNTRSPSSFDPNPVPTIASVTIDAAYLQAQATPFDGLTATLGVRLSRNSRFGEAINLRATAAYSPNGGDTVLRASIGDGFKAPTPFQLLSDFGNPTLRPEDAYAFDFSLEHRAFDGALQASIGYFERIAQDQIDFVSCFGRTEPFCIGRPFGTYDNVRAARAHGVEASLAWRPIEGLRIDANVTDLRAENRSTGSAAFGKDLPRRPRQTASLGASYVFDGGAEIGASALYVGANFDDSANLRRLKSYALLMVRGSLPVTETAALYGRIENVTDESYQTSFQYSGLPRQAVIGVRVVF